jgi:aminopeptidase
MKDPRIEKLADLVVNYSAGVKPEQKVFIKGGPAAHPMLLAVYQKVLEAGAYPFLVPTMSGQVETMFKYASDKQLLHCPEPLALVADTFDVYINVLGEENTKGLSNVSPEKNNLNQKAYSRFLSTVLNRAARKEMTWALTLFPTFAHAQDAEMSLSEYEDFVYNACMPDMNDPVGYWKKVSKKQDKIVNWLNGKKDIHVTGPETDLTLSVKDRTFINCDCHENVPDGEVFTGPVETSVNGHVYFSFPAIYSGREVTGVRLWFENGKVVKATADKNEAFLLKTLDTDAGSRYVGEFAIGTNEGINKFTGEILFDEKIGGSFHMAVGMGYPETGNTNKSAIHWDMICDMRSGGEMTADGEVFYKNGKFVMDL